MITTPILKLRSGELGQFYGDDFWDMGWYFCNNELHEVFDFPHNSSQIQLQVWPEPGQDRVTIKIIKETEETWFMWGVQIIGEESTRYIDHGCMDKIKKLTKRRRTWYVKLFYWE